ncbi:MAG: pyridoxal phosphate-dependent aminotransferase [Myxococcales bacterium]|jgi:hypothetical protein|nr:pyridoxal phosphate-dependent aminotransferase [Myxococcales bacterium]
MVRRTKYLEWAVDHVGRSEYDLASSGIMPFAEHELPPLEGPIDARAYGALIEAIAAFNQVPDASIVPTLGTSHALFVAMSALLSPGDEVLVESPAYEPLVAIPEQLGAKVVSFERRPEARYLLEPNQVAAKMTDRTKLVVVTNLHNPTGVHTPLEVLGDIAAFCASRGATLLVDEVYAPFAAWPKGVFSASASQLGANVVCVSSLTKCWGAGPHRIGWVIASGTIADACRAHLMTTLGHLPVGHAARGVHLFKHLDVLSARAEHGLAKKRDLVSDWMTKRQDLAWSAPEHGLFGFAVRTKAPATDDLRARIERGQRDRHVLVVPGSFFGVPQGFRLAWSLPEERLTDALRRLAEVLDRPA